MKNLQPQTATPAASGVYRFGAAVAVFIVLITSTYLWLDRQATLDREQARGELLTRILFNHVTRTLESTTSLMTVANQWSESTSPSQEKLRSAIENSSFIRSMSMVSESGVVLASSEEGVVNQTLDWKSLGLERDVGKDLAAGRWQQRGGCGGGGSATARRWRQLGGDSGSKGSRAAATAALAQWQR